MARGLFYWASWNSMNLLVWMHVWMNIMIYIQCVCMYIYILYIHTYRYTHAHFSPHSVLNWTSCSDTCSRRNMLINYFFFRGWWQEKAKWEHTWGTWCNMQDWASVLAKHDGTTSTEPCWQGPEHSLFAAEPCAFSEKLELNNRKRRVGQREVEVVSARTSGVSAPGTAPKSSHVSAVE